MFLNLFLIDKKILMSNSFWFWFIKFFKTIILLLRFPLDLFEVWRYINIHPILSLVERSLLLWLACVLIYTWEYIGVIFFNAYFIFRLSFPKRSLHSLWSVEMGECWMVLIAKVFVFNFLLNFWFIIFWMPTLSFALVFLWDFLTTKTSFLRKLFHAFALIFRDNYAKSRHNYLLEMGELVLFLFHKHKKTVSKY